MKTEEELKALKEEVEALNEKLTELSGEELAQVVGGFIPPTVCPQCGSSRIFTDSDGSYIIFDPDRTIPQYETFVTRCADCGYTKTTRLRVG